MTILAVDTHTAVWYLSDDRRLKSTAGDALDRADRILLPSIGIVEIIYLVEKRKLDAANLPRILNELDHPDTKLILTPLDHGAVLSLQDIPRHKVPDMPDRIISATALYHRVALVTRDRKIRKSGIKTIW